MNITNFVKTYYDIEFAGENVNFEDLSEVSEFLLKDTHQSQGHSTLNSLFINTFGRPGEVECTRAMENVKPEENTQSVWLKAIFRLMGWDLGRVGEITQSQEVQEIADLELEGQVLLKHLMEATTEEDKEVTTSQTVDVFEKSLAAQKKFSFESITDQVVATFPERVKSMQHSLDGAKQIGLRTFLLAGGEHLIRQNFGHPNFSLDAFHAFLKPRKVVILSPKPWWVGRLGSDREEKIKDLNDLIRWRQFQKLAAMICGKPQTS